MAEEVTFFDGTTVEVQVQYMPNNPSCYLAIRLVGVHRQQWRKIKNLLKDAGIRSVKVKPKGTIVFKPSRGEAYGSDDRDRAVDRGIKILTTRPVVKDKPRRQRQDRRRPRATLVFPPT